MVELLELLQNEEISSETLVKFYCERAMISGHFYNCITDQCFVCRPLSISLNKDSRAGYQEEAIEAARQADAHLRTTKTLLGPLHGIPVSIKDCFDMKVRGTHPLSFGCALT